MDPSPEEQAYYDQLEKEAKEQQAYYEEVTKAAAAWIEKWPNHCTKCGGWGAFYYRGNREESPSSEPCEGLPEGTCHRCGKADALKSEDLSGPCIHCGWNYDDGVPTP